MLLRQNPHHVIECCCEETMRCWSNTGVPGSHFEWTGMVFSLFLSPHSFFSLVISAGLLTHLLQLLSLFPLLNFLCLFLRVMAWKWKETMEMFKSDDFILQMRKLKSRKFQWTNPSEREQTWSLAPLIHGQCVSILPWSHWAFSSSWFSLGTESD